MPPTDNPEGTVPPAQLPARLETRRSGGDVTTPSKSRPLRRLALPADPIAISVARHQVHRWLAGLSWPAGQLEDIVRAVSEAVTNAIEHAYLDQPPGLVDVRGGVEATPGGQRRVTIIVRDHGRWRLAPTDQEHSHRGIPLMPACMDTATIATPDDGQVGSLVGLRRSAVPPSSEHDRHGE